MKNLNLIKWLWDDSHEKQTPQRFGRYAVMLLMLFTIGGGQMWGTDYTIYVTGALFGDAWDDETSTIYLGYNYYDGGDKWKEPFELTNTGKTYEGSPIYSAVVNYSDAKLFFKHYQGGEEKSSVQASSGSDWTGVSSVAGQIYQGWNGSTHVWATYGRDITVYAVPESMDGSKWTEGNTLKAVFKYGDQDSEKTDKLTFTKTDETYKGNYIYKSPSVLIPYNVIKKISFYYNDGSDKDLYDLTPGSQYGTDDIDGKIFLGYISSSHTWVNYGRDVTVYSIPDYLFGAYGTPYSEASHYPAVCIQMENGSTWDTENMTKTSYTYATYPIYKATILIKNNKFWEYQIKYFKKSDDTQVNLYQFNDYEPKTEYAPTFIDDKIYRGYITDAHVFTPYSYDLALNQQGGASGSSSVIVAEGSAMPSATMPSNSGYSFGGYYDEVAGGGTQYYAANGSSATNWDNRTKTTLYAKWTQSVPLDKENGESNGSVTLTYNSASHAAITNPTKTNYTFEGWYSGDDGAGQQIINTSGVLQANKTDGVAFTGASGVWIHAGSAPTLHAKWSETPRTITTSSGEGGSVDAASYTAYVVTTTAISATPATGYKFDHWEVLSGSVTIADLTSASTTITATSGGSIKAHFVYRWSIAGSWKIITPGEGDPYWDADAYSMGNIGTNLSSKDTCYVEISLPANTTYTFDVVDRSTSPYTFHKNGNDKIYYMTYGNSTNWGFGTTTGYNYDCGITTAGAGTYKFAYNITDGKLTVYYPSSYTVTFGYGTGGSAVTATVEDASSISSGDYATAGKDITFTKTATNLAYTFKGWYDAASDGSAISCMSSDDVYDDIAANISVYAQFYSRYGLHGSLSDDSESAGMPGWEGDGADFSVEDFDAIGEGDGKGVDLQCTRTLEPNRGYKFRIQDRAAGSRWGYSTSGHVLPAEGSGSNIKLDTYGDALGKDVFISTVGYGEYTFKITNMYDNGDGNYYPAIEVERVASSQLTLGWKHYTANSLEDGNIGGTVTAATNEGSGFAITNGQFYANGSTLTFTASPAEGYHVAGWYSDASCETAYDDAYISGEGDVTLTLSSVSTNKIVYVKFEEESNTFNANSGNNWTTTANWSEGREPLITDVVYINAPVIVDDVTARAKRVIIYNDGGTHTGKLTVDAGKKLIVAETIKKNNGSALVATTENDLVINSDATGVGALVWGEANTSPGAATVNFYSISGGAKDNKASVNQFIGTPFTSETSSWLYNYYNSWVLGVDYTGDAPAFYLLGNETMDPFKGYCIIYNGSTGHTYNMSGTLVTNADHTCSSLSYKSGDASNMANENLLANPWLAPIKINAMQSADFTNTEATIYIFNSKSEKGNSNSKVVSIGNYTGHTVGTAGGNVIPAMQSFSVFTTAASGSVALDYSKIVYNPATVGTNPAANKAPKRVAEEEANKVRVFVSAESGYGDMVYMWERSDFSEGFENGWDGHKIQGDKEAPQFYAVTPDGNMAVNCVPTFENTVMGFKAGTEDTQYTFSFEYNNENDALYLYDMDENKYTRVLEGNTYTFSTTDKLEHNRFILTRNMPQNPTGIENKYQDGVKAVKFLEDGKLFILRSGKLYDATGALVK